MQIFIRRTIFQLYRGIRPCYFWWNDDNVCFVLTELDFYSPISLKQNKSPQIDMSLHSYKLSCHPLPLFLHATRTNYAVTPCHYFSMPLVQIILTPLAIISLCHSHQLSWHPLPLFLHATCTNYPDTPCHYFSMLRINSGEANSNFKVFSLTGKWIELTIYGTWGEQTNHYTSETVTNVSIKWRYVNSTYNAGISIRGGTRYFYLPKMVFDTSWF